MLDLTCMFASQGLRFYWFVACALNTIFCPIFINWPSSGRSILAKKKFPKTLLLDLDGVSLSWIWSDEHCSRIKCNLLYTFSWHTQNITFCNIQKNTMKHTKDVLLKIKLLWKISRSTIDTQRRVRVCPKYAWHTQNNWTDVPEASEREHKAFLETHPL